MRHRESGAHDASWPPAAFTGAVGRRYDDSGTAMKADIEKWVQVAKDNNLKIEMQ
jgi:hypothetical protein